LASRPRPDDDRLEQASGRWHPGDRFLLMTDALAAWFLRQNAAGDRPWEVVDRLLAEDDADAGFESWLDALRDLGDLRNDDVTMIVVDLAT
jgi:hypothetical protein